jgi:23S rRNA pseudouridine1911/1915/1917 synthase
VLERLPGHTVVEVKLETGRRNQIRVQFAERGFPLLGDQVYGQPSDIIDRQALHAELLGFRHPVTGEAVSASAPMPSDMEKVLRILRNVRRVERADAGVTGEEGIYKPKITSERKLDRVRRAERYTKDDDRSERRPRAEGPREDAAPRPRRAFGPPAEGDRPRKPFAPRAEGSKPRAEGSRPRPEGTRTAGPRTPGRPTGAKPAGSRPAQRPSGAPRKPGPKRG